MEAICLACLNKSKDLKSIFSFITEEEMFLSDILSQITGMTNTHIENFQHNYLCLHCESRLLDAFNFRKHVWKNFSMTTSSDIPTRTPSVEHLDGELLEIEKVVEDDTEENTIKLEFDGSIASDSDVDVDGDDDEDNEYNYDSALDDIKNVFVIENAEIVRIAEEMGDVKMLKSESNLNVSVIPVDEDVYEEDDDTGSVEYLIEEIPLEPTSLPQTNLIDVSNSTNLNKPIHQCYICDEIFSSPSNLYRHMKRKHLPDYRNMDRVGDGKLLCEFCHIEMSSVSNLNRHMRRVHFNLRDENKPSKCRVCQIIFSTQREYLHHRRKVHDIRSNKQFICDHCGRGLRSAQCLKEHVRIHTGEKPFACDECNYRTGHKMAMVFHKRTHTKEKPYACDVCSSKFRTISARAEHRVCHSEDRPYVCSVCNKMFKKKQILRGHMRTHDKN